MDKFKELFESWISLIPRITVGNVIEILIIAVIVYAVLKLIKNSRSWVLLRGLLVIFIFVILCELFHLDTVLWIFGKLATVAVFALIVVFQPELRKALEKLGSAGVLKSFAASIQHHVNGLDEKTLNEIVKAAFELAKTKTGALIVLENNDSLLEIERTGIEIDARVTSQLLVNIFEHNTPLHDGAVVITDNKVGAATCYLPLSDNMSISKAYGTRHRAALGMSEASDSLTVVVSEETGKVSLAEGGQLTNMNNADELRAALSKLIPEEEKKHLLRGRKNEDK